MNQAVSTRLTLLCYFLLFYWYYDKLLHWYLDQIPQVPPITEPFEKMIEITTPGAHSSDEELIELPREQILLPMSPLPMMMGETIIIVEGDPQLLQHFASSMLGENGKHYLVQI